MDKIHKNERPQETNKTETLKNELHTLTDKMDEYQLRLVTSFIKTLFDMKD